MAYTILVALDESPWAEAAAETALTLAERSPGPSRLLALHVLNVTHITGHILHDLGSLLGFEPVLVPPSVEGVFRARGQALLDRFVARAEARGLEAEAILDQGAVAKRLLHHAATVDLVVAGSAGETEHAYPGQGGGNLHRLLRESPTTVLVTPREPLKLTGITLGHDGSDGAQVALRAVSRLATRLSLPVHVRYVRDGRRPEAHAPLAGPLEWLEREGLVCDAAEVRGEAHEALPFVAEQLGDDVLALGWRGRSLLKGILLGRVPIRLVGQVELGLLIAH
ncbi:MAG: universal stress protein [Alphaproteobacteria bacterium]|nr:universal stress protein [Alphaproteobacteria bacterium]MCB9791766.1 universal stress protein [Alphaproteobacteria bacterium]